MIRSSYWAALLGPALVACVTATPGAKPHDMGAAGHEGDAEMHAAKAAAHDAKYDPSASTTRERCRSRLDRVAQGGGNFAEVCWTSVTNPTEAHLKMAAEHRQHAADHRGASAALREAESKACAGIAPDDRDISPFDRADDITKVEVLKERSGSDKQPSERIVGATVTFRAMPGLTAEGLQRIVDCHLARNAALGHTVPEMPNCPLVPNGARAQATPTADGFAVAVRSDDPETSKDVVSRAQRLRAGVGAR